MSDSERLSRIEAALENQVEVNASLRTSLEVQKSSIDTLLRIVELHQQNIEVLAEAMRRHRSDGHGG